MSKEQPKHHHHTNSTGTSSTCIQDELFLQQQIQIIEQEEEASISSLTKLTPTNLLSLIRNSLETPGGGTGGDVTTSTTTTISKTTELNEQRNNIDSANNITNTNNINVNVTDLIKRMTIKEKLKVLTGSTFWMTIDLNTIQTYQDMVTEKIQVLALQETSNETSNTTSKEQQEQTPNKMRNNMLKRLLSGDEYSTSSNNNNSSNTKTKKSLFSPNSNNSNNSNSNKKGKGTISTSENDNNNKNNDCNERKFNRNNSTNEANNQQQFNNSNNTSTVYKPKSIVMCDGPHGLRKPIKETSLQFSYSATCFPSTSTIACCWDPVLVHIVGHSIQLECIYHNVQLLLSPGINIKRHCCNGRNFEYYSEDPLLTGILASAMIRGIQQTQQNNTTNTNDTTENTNNTNNNIVVGACVKHFAVNNQETNRFVIDSIIDDRTLYELYLRSFHIIINNGHCNLNKSFLNSTYGQSKENYNQPVAIMTSYNKVNGLYVNENNHLLQTTVRHQWNYNGIYVSDWGATNDRIQSILSGMDLEMPGSYNAHTIELLKYYYNEQINNSSTSTTSTGSDSDDNNDDEEQQLETITTTTTPFAQAIDECVYRLITFIQSYYNTTTIQPTTTSSHSSMNKEVIGINNEIGNNIVNNDNSIDDVENGNDIDINNNQQQQYVSNEYEKQLLEKNYKIAHQVAVECCVILKNDNQCLPLQLSTSTSNTTITTTTTTIAIIGDFGKNNTRFQGMGSSQINPYKVSNIYDSLHTLYDNNSNNTTGTNTSIITKPNIVFARGYDLDDNNENDIQQYLLDEALQTSCTADIVLVCIGLPEIMEMEGSDRKHINMPAQHIALVQQIGQQRNTMKQQQQQQKIIVLLSNGSSIIISPTWESLVDAIIEGYLLGSAGGDAIVDILYGISVPCGKLAESFPLSLNYIQSNQYFPGTRNRVEHREGLNIGYRQPTLVLQTTTTTTTTTNEEHSSIDDYNTTKSIAFAYPFGHGLSYTTFEYTNIRTEIIVDTQDDIVVNVIFDIQNIGTIYTGKEIVQCYIHDTIASIYRPSIELKSFTKICLVPQQKETITIVLTKDAFAYYDIGYNDWIVECGSFTILIGASSTDIRLTSTINLIADNFIASKEAILSYPPLLSDTNNTNNTIIVPETSLVSLSSSPNLDNDNNNNNNVFPIVDDITFSNRFGTSKSQEVLQQIQVIQQQTKTDYEIHYYGTVHRNTLIYEIAHRRFIGSIFYSIASRICIADLDKTRSDYKRQKHMMICNFNNIPLRALVLFGRGSIQYTLLDGIINLLNSNIIEATKLFLLTFKNMIFLK